jgi:PAS domain S-box-containing protein
MEISSKASPAEGASDASFRHLVQNAPDVIARFDRAHRYLFVNKAVEKVTGIAPHRFIGKTNQELGMPQPMAACWQQALQTAWGEERDHVFEFEVPGPAPSGNGAAPHGKRIYETRLTPERGPNGETVSMLAISRDITERKQAEQILQRRNAEVRLLFETGKQLGRTLELEAIYDALYKTVSQIMPCDTLIVSRFLPAKSLIVCSYIRHLGERQDESNLPPIALEPEGQGTQSVAIRTGESLLLNDYAERSLQTRRGYFVEDDGTVRDKHERREDETQTESALIVPMKLEGQVTGVIQVFSHQRQAYGKNDLRLLEALAPNIAAAASNAILYRQAQHEIAERRRAQVALRESEELYRTLVKTSPLAIVVTDLQARMLVANQRVLEITGYDHRDEILGRYLLEFVAAKDRPIAIHYFQVVHAEGVAHDVPCSVVRKDGSHIYCEVSASLLKGAGGKPRGLIIVVRDVTEQKLVEAAEKEQRALAQALADTTAIFNRTLDLDTVLDHILENVGKAAPHQGANIMLLQGNVARVRRYKGYEREDGPGHHILQHGFRIEETPTLRQMMETRRPVTVADTRHYAGWTDVPDTNWFCSYAGAPIVQDGEVIGFLNLDAAEPDFFTAEHAERLQAFADQVAVALRNAQLYEAEQKRRHVAETLAEAAAALNSSLALDDVLPQILEQLGRVIPYDTASVQEMVDDHLVIRSVKGFNDPSRNLNVAIEIAPRYPNATIVETRKPMAVPDIYSNWPAFREVQEIEAVHEIHSWLGVPLLLNNEVLGLITVDRHRVQPFTPEEVELAATFANHAAIALHNASLYNELAHSRDSLEMAVAARTSELQHTVDQLNAILTHSPEAILLLDEQERVEMGNPAVGRLFNYKRKEVIGQPLHFLVAEDDHEALAEAWEMALDSGETQRLQLMARRKGGFLFDADVALSPIRQSDGAFSIVCGLHDISGLKEVERMKDAFVSNVSHELRTPIASLKLYHGLLSRTDKKRDIYMGRVEREIDRLYVTIEDLLRLSRLEQGHVPLQRQRIDLRTLVEQYVTDRSLLAEHKGLSLQLEPAPRAAEVNADPGLLGQVLSILLTNALTYTPEGGSVRAGVCHRSEGQQALAGFYVRDTGAGIDPEEREKLFQRFYRGHAGKSSGSSGTGLGLSIAQEIVHQHQGRIEVESEGVPGRGATFMVWFPAV